jgi:hypothetical protein
VDANLARRTMANAPTGAAALTRGEKDQVGTVKDLVRSQAYRVLLALVAIGSSALVLEAGRRWN